MSCSPVFNGWSNLRWTLVTQEGCRCSTVLGGTTILYAYACIPCSYMTCIQACNVLHVNESFVSLASQMQATEFMTYANSKPSDPSMQN